MFISQQPQYDPRSLADRMKVSGYVSEEKTPIASRYLGPWAKEASGLKNADILLKKGVVNVFIEYCRESGVGYLKKHIDKVCFLLINLLIIIFELVTRIDIDQQA